MTIAQQLERKGFEKGRCEGERYATLRIAHAMLKHGLDHHMIMQTTGLSEAELKRLNHSSPPSYRLMAAAGV